MNDVMLMSPGSSSNFLEVDTLVKHLSNHETDGSTEKKKIRKTFFIKILRVILLILKPDYSFNSIASKN